ncbi:hypothetical protein VD0002_g5194 [Verticillium dahliae]|uniref:Uncharacterized protein n=1 Tax=Verticillium dahliae TaxID=27337 RepID=A0AA44WBA3_VERDA|nr:hypothetical protein BJF96_g9049 [Verticillium dahliae]PNH50569.1 hypothetical protein VD0003_g6600 [Verticillium dahliae]PNH63061.1 hypothetical protein VD0002_g5194 [Verticillium dahliae]
MNIVKPQAQPLPSLQTAWERHTPQPNPATCHPVFFSERLRRPPTVLGRTGSFSPVAQGYIYRESGRADSDAVPKL